MNAYDQLGRTAIGLPPAGALEMALLRIERGEIGEAEALVRLYLAQDLNQSHRRYLREFLPTQGLGHLLDS